MAAPSRLRSAAGGTLVAVLVASAIIDREIGSLQHVIAALVGAGMTLATTRRATARRGIGSAGRQAQRRRSGRPMRGRR